MAKIQEPIRGNYRGHSYKLILIYLQVTGGDMPNGGEKFMTDAEITVDGKMLTHATPGFVGTDEFTKPAVMRTLKAYIDYLEDK